MTMRKYREDDDSFTILRAVRAQDGDWRDWAWRGIRLYPSGAFGSGPGK